MSDDDNGALAQLKKTVVETAAEAVVMQMTPAMMRKCAQEILEKVLGEISSNEYGSVGRMVREKAEKAMKEHLKTDEAKQLIAACVRRATNQTAQNLDERLATELTQTCIRAVTKALTEEQRRY
jgi:hypothetical protein